MILLGIIVIGLFLFFRLFILNSCHLLLLPALDDATSSTSHSKFSMKKAYRYGDTVARALRSTSNSLTQSTSQINSTAELE